MPYQAMQCMWALLPIQGFNSLIFKYTTNICKLANHEIQKQQTNHIPPRDTLKHIFARYLEFPVNFSVIWQNVSRLTPDDW